MNNVTIIDATIEFTPASLYALVTSSPWAVSHLQPALRGERITGEAAESLQRFGRRGNTLSIEGFQLDDDDCVPLPVVEGSALLAVVEGIQCPIRRQVRTEKALRALAVEDARHRAGARADAFDARDEDDDDAAFEAWLATQAA